MTPEQVLEMTTDEIRDTLAKMDGWTREEEQWWKLTTGSTRGGRTWCTHPHPYTRDGAAAALPKGWRLELRQCCVAEHTFEWAWRAIKPETVLVVVVLDTGNEILDRYRLALLVRLIEEKKGKKA